MIAQRSAAGGGRFGGPLFGCPSRGSRAAGWVGCRCRGFAEGFRAPPGTGEVCAEPVRTLRAQRRTDPGHRSVGRRRRPRFSGRAQVEAWSALVSAGQRVVLPAESPAPDAAAAAGPRLRLGQQTAQRAMSPGSSTSWAIARPHVVRSTPLTERTTPCTSCPVCVKTNRSGSELTSLGRRKVAITVLPCTVRSLVSPGGPPGDRVSGVGYRAAGIAQFCGVILFLPSRRCDGAPPHSEDAPLEKLSDSAPANVHRRAPTSSGHARHDFSNAGAVESAGYRGIRRRPKSPTS